MVIYYDRNSYSLTRLGKIINVTQDELKNALGKGNVSVVLSFRIIVCTSEFSIRKVKVIG